MPVGIETLDNEDVPYWPNANACTYKEVWLTTAGRWLAIMADLYPNESKNRYEWQPSPGSGYVISDGTYQLL